MEPQDRPPAQTLIRAFERPAFTVMVVCQMLLGLGLAIALVLKIYMLVFTDQVCAPDAGSLGNMIRCAQTLEVLSHFLIMAAGFRFAALMFTAAPTQVLEPLLLALTGIFLLFLSDLSVAGSTWYLSLIILALFAAIGGVFTALRLWGSPSNPR